MWVRFPSPAFLILVSCAAVAQLVERILGKDEVMGSIPISSSTLNLSRIQAMLGFRSLGLAKQDKATILSMI